MHMLQLQLDYMHLFMTVVADHQPLPIRPWPHRHLPELWPVPLSSIGKVRQ
jgi:hypothetical protein